MIGVTMRRLPLLAAVALTLAVGVGCAEHSLSSGRADMAGGAFDEADSDDAFLDTASPAPSDEQALPVYWSLDGDLAVQGGIVDLDLSGFVVRTWDAELEAVCAYDVAISAAVSAPIPEAELGLIGWFELDLASAMEDNAACPDWQARSLALGLGDYDARLDPALDAHGWEQSQPYGLYLQEPGQPLYVVGVGGTRDHFDGDVGLQTAGPIEDGLYELHSVVLLDLVD
jgi:hypothetical protein